MQRVNQRIKNNLVVPLGIVVLVGLGSATSVQAQSRGVILGSELDRQKAFLRTYCNPPSPEMVSECYHRIRYVNDLQRQFNIYINRRNRQAERIYRRGINTVESLRNSNCLASSRGC